MEQPKPSAAQHSPFVPAHDAPPELSLGPVIVGVLLGVVFGASSLYLTLRVGMSISASIPIAVLSITVFRALAPIFGRNATILENNIVQTTGSAGESIAFGVAVTMPALMILGFELDMMRAMTVAVLGGLLGVLMMIPLRRAFIVKQHGALVYPEGTACAEVLIAGERGGRLARLVFVGFGFAFVYKFIMMGLKLWNETPTRVLKFFKGAFVSCEVAPELLGVGYIIGTRTSCIMVAGGILAAWVLTPAITLFGGNLTTPLYPGTKLISAMDADDIRDKYVLYIGAGAVAAGGIIAMLHALPMIFGSLRSALGDLAGSVGGASAGTARTERDLPMWLVVVGALGLIVAIWLAPILHMTLVGALLIVVFGFLFVTVSSRLVGLIGSSSNPISGMTVATLLTTCLIFLSLGRTSPTDELTALSVAAVVCIAASNGGATSQDLKTGFLVGGTPWAQQIAILVGALTSALVIGYTLSLLNDAATIYSTKNLPAVHVDVSKLTEKQAPRGETSQTDKHEYFVLRAKDGEIPGVEAGKYLVDDSGAIRYYVDPGVNGRLKARDDGVTVPKYKAPKAALMAFIIDGILGQKLPWSLVLLGVSIALVLELAGIPSLPFAVGVYLPLSTSMPIFVGGIIRWLADKWARRRADESDTSPGVLLSSGFIAGGAIAGIAVALASVNSSYAQAMQSAGAALLKPFGIETDGPELAMAAFSVLTVFLLIVGAGKLLATQAKKTTA